MIRIEELEVSIVTTITKRRTIEDSDAEDGYVDVEYEVNVAPYLRLYCKIFSDSKDIQHLHANDMLVDDNSVSWRYCGNGFFQTAQSSAINTFKNPTKLVIIARAFSEALRHPEFKNILIE